MGLTDILNRRKQSVAAYNDDIRVIRSFVEYGSDGQTVSGLVFELEMMDKTGELRHFYKVVRLVRLIRLPKEAKQSLSFMDVHRQVLTGIWERGCNFVTIIANMIHPVPLGLLYLYGIQGVAEDLETARRIATNDYAALVSLIQGTYRTMEFRPINQEEVEWLREKMYAMKHMTVVRGIPKAEEGGVNAGNKGMGGANVNPNSTDTTEEFIAALADREYVVQILTTPVSERSLRDWLTQTAKEMTRWQGQLQGQKAMNFGISLPMMYMANLGASEGWSHAYTDAQNVGHAVSHTVGESFSESVSSSHSVSQGDSMGTSKSISESASISHTDGESASTSRGHTEGTSYGFNESESVSSSHSKGTSESFGITESHGKTDGVSSGESSGSSSSRSVGESSSQSQSDSHSYSKNEGVGNNQGVSANRSASDSMGANIGAMGVVGGSIGHSDGVGSGASAGESISQGVGESTGRSTGTSRGTSESFSNSNSFSQSQSRSSSISDTIGMSQSRGISESWSDSQSQSRGQSFGASSSDSVSNSRGVSTSNGWSKGIGSSEGVSASKSQSESWGVSQGFSKGQSVSDGKTDSWGRSQGQSLGTSGGLTQATAGTMGIGPSLSFSKSFQWLDQEVQNIITLLEFQNDRLMRALNGNGAFFTDMYIATPDEETKSAASASAKSTWHNDGALICPLQVMDLSPEEEGHLLYHFNAFSADTTMEGIPGQIESYRFSTVLLAEEAVAYTHPPRISEGGIFADVSDIPKLAVPSMKKGEIYLGKILSGERYTQKWGYVTPFEFRLASNEIMHGYFTGESRSGKTVAATRFVAELANKVVRDNGKRMRIIAMDPKQDWRILAKFIEPERFHFYSLGNPEFLPINLNICKIPKNVYPQQWVDGIIEIYCRAYGLGERGKSVLAETFYQLYEEAGVFVPNWREVAAERSRSVTFPRLFERMMKIKLDLENPQSKKGKVGNDVRDAYSRVLDRMQVFGRSFSIEAQLFGREDGMGIDDLIGGDDVVVLESYGLESTFKNFVFGVITSGFFKYAQAHEGGFKSPDQYETMLIIEEANEVLTGSDTASGGNNSPLGGQSEFEKILDQSAGLGLFIISITQKIADMPSSVIANSGLVFAGKISRPDDVTTVVRKIGREERYEDRDLLKWFPRSPIGWFVCRSSRNFDFKETEPSLVKIEPLNVNPPTNDELLHLMAIKEARARTARTV